MKLILLLLLTSSAMVGCADRQTHSIYEFPDAIPMNTAQEMTLRVLWNDSTEPKPRYDTIPCLMLVSDTSIGVSHAMAYNLVPTKFYRVQPGTIWQIKGYEVIQRWDETFNGLMTMDSTGHLIVRVDHHAKHISWLHPNKNPMKLFVWVSKDL